MCRNLLNLQPIIEHIFMKRLLFIFSFFSLFVANGKAQGVETLTLEDCLRIGIDNNLSLESKRKEMQKSKYGVSEIGRDCCRRSMPWLLITITSIRRYL